MKALAKKGNLFRQVCILRGKSRGRGTSDKSDSAFGIFLSVSSATIAYSTINPGSGNSRSTGINTIAGSSVPIIHNCTIGSGKAKWTTGILLKDSVNAQIADNNIDGGNWTIGSGGGYCIYLLTANATNATISGNNLTIFDLLHSDTYGIFDSDSTPKSDPYLLRNNDFNYDGNWYFIDGTTPVTITKSNYLGEDVHTTGDGTDKLFNTTWGNHSTATNKP
jgi:hypothetical protein